MGKMDQVKNWLKNHKKGVIVAGTAIVIVGGTLVLLKTGKLSSAKKAFIRVLNINCNKKGVKCINDLPKVVLRTGEMLELWNEGECVNSIITGSKVSELGRLGEDLMQIPGILPDTTVDAVIGLK